MKPTYLTRIPAAEAHIRATGERLTQPRVAMLATLMTADHAISHLDAVDALAKHHPMDRVTVYRVLEWLVTMGIAHRIAGDDRVWRFMLTAAKPNGKANAQHLQHAHFTCNDCGQTFCLDEVSPKLPVKVPAGFKTIDVDLKLRGQCAHCA